MGKNGVKIGIIVVAFAGAIIAWIVSNREEPLPADVVKPQMVDLVCTECGAHTQDSADNLAKVKIEGGIRTPEGEGGFRRMAKVRTKYPCSACNQPAAVHAKYCQDHDLYYPAESESGGGGKCPKCP